MEELKRAFKTLEIPESANMSQVEDRYFLLLRRHKNNTSSPTEADHKKFDEQTEAYRLLKDHFTKLAMESNEVYKAEQKKSPRRRKFEHFMSYYRWHVIGSILLIIFIGTFINSMVNKEKEIPAETSVMLVGEYYINDPKPLEQNLTELVPEWERVKAIVNLTPNESSQQYDTAYLQKSMVMLATERPDIYIVDVPQFQRIGAQRAFMPLDEHKEMFEQKLGPSRLTYAKFDEDTELRLYGVDLSASPIFDGIIAERYKEIFTIRSSNEDPTNAMKLINAVIDSLP